MALTVYRFRGQGPSVNDLSKEVPGNPSVAAASYFYVDVQVDSAYLQDLTDAMTARGYVLDSTAPTTTPAQQEAANTPPTFSGVSSALAAANAPIAFNSQRLTNLSDPTSAQDAATKAYVDATKQGLDIKDSVRAVSTSNITLSGTQTIDGVSLSVGDRVLVAGQTTASQNGIYAVAAGAWARATDADTSAKVTGGLFTFVTEGTANADSGWVLTTNDVITLGTTGLAFTQFSGAGQISAGAGLTKSGNTINAGANADGSIVVNADDIQVGVLATDAQHGTRGGGSLHANVITGGASGFMSGSDKAKLDGLPTVPKTDTLIFGNSGIGTSTTPRFLSPGYNPNQAPTTAAQFRMPTAGTIKNLRVHANTVGVGAANITYTVRKNGTATGVTCTGPATSVDLSDTTDTVVVAAGDLIDVISTKAAAITTSPIDVLVTLEVAP